MGNREYETMSIETEKSDGVSPAEKSEPGLLDVVKIDGRWAQVVGGGGYVRFLDNAAIKEIDWDTYKLVRRFHSSIRNLPEIEGEKISDKEIDVVHWETEAQKKYPKLKREVSVFGEYVKK